MSYFGPACLPGSQVIVAEMNPCTGDEWPEGNQHANTQLSSYPRLLSPEHSKLGSPASSMAEARLAPGPPQQQHLPKASYPPTLKTLNPTQYFQLNAAWSLKSATLSPCYLAQAAKTPNMSRSQRAPTLKLIV